MENLKDLYRVKFQHLIDLKANKRISFLPVTNTDTRPHFTVQKARQKCLVTGQCFT